MNRNRRIKDFKVKKPSARTAFGMILKNGRRPVLVLCAFLCIFLAAFLPLFVKADEESFFDSADDSVVFYNNGEAELTVKEDAIRNWGSMSTLLIWIGIMQLKEQGLIDFDEAVSTYLPQEFNDAADFPYSFTVLDLMNQSAGFEVGTDGRFLLTDETIDSLYVVLKSTIPDQINEPGQFIAFSDWGCLLCAYLIEARTGLSYVEYVHENILDPLQMTETSVAYDYSDNPDIAAADGLPTVRSAYFPVYSARGSMKDMTKLFRDLTGKKSVLLTEETLNEFFSCSRCYRDLSDSRIAHGLAYYYEYEKPVYGLRGHSYMGSQEFYISEDRCQFYIRLNDNNSKTFPVMDDSENSPRSFFGSREKKDGPFRNKISGMEGLYVKADMPSRGMARILSFIDTYKFSAIDDVSLSLSLFGSEPAIIQISETGFMTSGGEIGYFTGENTKNAMIEYPTQDMIKYSVPLQMLQKFAFFLYEAGILYSFNALVIAFFIFLFRKITGRKHNSYKFRKYHFIQCACFLCHGVFFHIMAFAYLSGFNVSIINSASLMYYFSIIISFVYLLFFGKTGFKEECGKFEKTLYFITGFLAVVLIIFNFAFGLVLRS